MSKRRVTVVLPSSVINDEDLTDMSYILETLSEYGEVTRIVDSNLRQDGTPIRIFLIDATEEAYAKMKYELNCFTAINDPYVLFPRATGYLN